MILKKGTKVKCINKVDYIYIEVGKEYILDEEYNSALNNKICIYANDNQIHYYFLNLFEVIEEKKEEEIKMEEKDIMKILKIKRVIVKEAATIIIWEDDTKTIVKRNKEDKFDTRLGFFYGWFQKTSGLSRNKANKFVEELTEELDLR